MGVRMRAVASFERIIEIKQPSKKVFSSKRRELPAESPAALAASQSKRPAASAMAESVIMPRKKKKIFQSPSRTVRASSGAINPSSSSRAAPPSAILASSSLNGRSMMPTSVKTAMIETRMVFVSVGTWKKRNMELQHQILELYLFEMASSARSKSIKPSRPEDPITEYQ